MKGTILVTEGIIEMSTSRGEFSVELFESLSLSDDGRTLTVDSTRITPRDHIAATLVYRKR